jgi:uncharacterized protein YhdP
VLHKLSLGLVGGKVALDEQRVLRGDMEALVTDNFNRVSVSISSGAAALFANTFTEIFLKTNFFSQDLKIENLSLKWGDSRFKAKGRISNLSAPKEISVSGSFDRLRWESAEELIGNIKASIPTAQAVSPEAAREFPQRSWVKTFKYSLPRKLPDMVGHIQIGEVTHQNFSFKNADFLWDLRRLTRSLKKVGGDFRAGFGPGRVSDIQAVQDASKFLKIVFLPYVYMHRMNNLSVLSAATAYPKTLDFGRIEGQYGIEEGIVTTRFFHVDSPQLVAYADGTADFGKETVDMSILTRLTNYRAPLPEWWVDELGRPAIGFRVKGDLNKPELEPRLSKMAADEIEKALEEGLSRARKRFEAIEKLETL